MYKLLIADDEAMIRRGLKNSLKWDELNIEVIGEAEDGELALDMAKEMKPDIMLVDICMPFLNGLELISKLNDANTNCLIIIITGYDEFKYMHEALKLKVFDYLLKPLNKDELKKTVIKATNELSKDIEERNYFDWANKQLNENLDALRQTFLNNWLNGNFEYEQVISELNYLKVQLGDNIGMIVIKIIDRFNLEVLSKNLDRKLLSFAIENIASEMLLNLQPVIIFSDEENNIVIISNIGNIAEWMIVGSNIQEKIFQYLHYTVVLEQKKIQNGIFGVKNTYKDIVEDIRKKSEYKPVVFLAIRYIEANYFVNDLSLERVAEEFNVTASYISKLLKQETGQSFVEFLTNLRIKKAIYIMDDPSVKMYEVAELVGYSNQHYFCKAFKRVMGFSPTEYREGGS